MPFTPGRSYRRRDIHDRFDGQQQGGISTPAEHPYIFIFTGEQGEQYGYHDEFVDEGTFLYTGEGRVGDMEFIRGNRAIRDHEADGKEIHLFTYAGQERGHVEYVGKASYVDHHWFTSEDQNGDPREAIRFELAIDAGEDGTPSEGIQEDPDEGSARLWRRSLEDLRREALESEDGEEEGAADRRRRVYRRSRAVKTYARRRADGACEACGEQAPFETPSGRPFLEVHHIRRRSDEGPDHPRWVAAICPNCHRRIHHGADGDAINERLADRVGALEGS